MSARSTVIASDYWRLRIHGTGTHPVVLVEGRRRTTESFWAPLEIDGQQLERFVETLGNTLSIATGFCDDPRRPAAPLFPAYEMVAACQGSSYWLEVTETTIAAGKSSVAIVVYTLESLVRPVLYLVDDEINEFHEDLQKIQRLLTLRTVKDSHTSHPVESAGVAVRDAIPLARCRVIPSANGWRDE